MRRPTDSSVITMPYGATTAPYSKSNPHAGVDYRAPQGANIYAPHSGKVTVASTQGSCGLAVDIDGGRFKSRLCHNSSKTVNVGQQVSEGQVVAKAGSTGQASGPHCHWVLWDNGTRVDGSKYITDNGGSMATIVDDNITRLLYSVIMHRIPDTNANKDQYDAWRGREIIGVITDMYKSGEWQSIDNALKVNKIREDRLNKIGAAVGLNPDKDGLDAIVSKVESLAKNNSGVVPQELKKGIYEVK